MRLLEKLRLFESESDRAASVLSRVLSPLKLEVRKRESSDYILDVLTPVGYNLFSIYLPAGKDGGIYVVVPENVELPRDLASLETDEDLPYSGRVLKFNNLKVLASRIMRIASLFKGSIERSFKTERVLNELKDKIREVVRKAGFGFDYLYPSAGRAAFYVTLPGEKNSILASIAVDTNKTYIEASFTLAIPKPEEINRPLIKALKKMKRIKVLGNPKGTWKVVFESPSDLGAILPNIVEALLKLIVENQRRA